MDTWYEMYDFLYKNLGINEQAIDLAFYIGGQTVETGNKILEYYTGFCSFEEYQNEMGFLPSLS